MRLRQSRIKTYYAKKTKTVKDKEGSTYTEYESSVSFRGEVWPAGGKVQAEMYGERLSYIRNLRIEGEYTMSADEKGVIHYVFADGLDIKENDGLCLYVGKDSKPDYKILAIKPFTPIRLECEKL